MKLSKNIKKVLASFIGFCTGILIWISSGFLVTIRSFHTFDEVCIFNFGLKFIENCSTIYTYEKYSILKLLISYLLPRAIFCFLMVLFVLFLVEILIYWVEKNDR